MLRLSKILVGGATYLWASVLNAGDAVSVRVDVDRELVQSIGVTQVEAWVQSTVDRVNESLAPVGLTLNVVKIQAWGWGSPLDPSNSFTLLTSYDTFLTGPLADPKQINIAFAQAQDTGGGAAWQNSVCDPYAVVAVRVPVDFGVSFRDHRASELTVHEIGHTFDLDHSHCQATPLDRCWSGGSPAGAYGGPCHQGALTCPSSGVGTVMSICYNGGCAPTWNLTTFHPVQLGQMEYAIATKTCLSVIKRDGFEGEFLRYPKVGRRASICGDVK